MVDWKSSSIQLISGVVGSSLFLFGVTTFYADYVQKPQIKIDTFPVPISYDRFDNGTYRFIYSIEVGIRNDGNTPATDVLLKFSGGNPVKHESVSAFSQENFTKEPAESGVFAWNISRLSGGATFTIIYAASSHYEENSIYFPDLDIEPGTSIVLGAVRGLETDAESETVFLNNYSRIFYYSIPDYTISFASDQGTKVVGGVPFGDSASRAVATLNTTLSPFLPLILLSAVSAAIFFMPRISDIIRRRRHGNVQIKMFISLLSEVKIVHDTLREDVNSKRIFPCKLWGSVSSDVKRELFDNYDDYNRINRFYEELKIRDTLLSANSDTFRFSNKELLQISDELLRKIRWARYQVIHFSVPVAKTVFSAVAMVFAQLMILLFLPSLLLNVVSNGIMAITILSITFIAVAVFVYALLEIILGTRSTFYKSKRSHFMLNLRRTMKIRLFVLCLIIVAVPSFFGLILGFPELPNLLDPLSSSTIIAILQIAAVFLLVLYASRKIKKSIVAL